MRQIEIDINEDEQRIDRFLRKYFPKATKSFIYKMLRKKRIKLNTKRANPEDMIFEGDTIQMYLSDQTIDKFRAQTKQISKDYDLDILYEDENIVLINKAKGVLSHSSSSNDNEKNIVDEFISYLYSTGVYIPEEETTFTPSICNRLDRNTSGIIIGAKNYNTLKEINNSLKNRDISRYYKTIVKGDIGKDQLLEGYLVKNQKNNKVSISKENLNDGKDIKTEIKVIDNNKNYSLLEINLITGRTHQIRAHLASINHPIIGDVKYGDRETNDLFREKHRLTSQYLHAYRIILGGLESGLEYLNNQEFICNVNRDMENIEKSLFNKQL